jgi:putative membrane protein
MKSIRSFALLGATALMAGSFAISSAMAQSTTPPAVKAERQAATQQPLTATNYVTYAQNSDLFEIEAGKIAVQKAQNKEVREYARQMVDHHTATANRLNASARQSGVTATVPALSVKQRTKLDELQNASLSSFDKLYITTQLEAHERAIRLHNSYAMTGDQPMLRSASTEMVPTIRAHLSEAQRISGIIANERGGAS